jgi:hypothetical protein
MHRGLAAAAMAQRSRGGALRLVVLLSSLAAASGFWPAGAGTIPIAPEHSGRSVAGSRRYSTRRLALTRRTRPLETKRVGVHGLRSMAVDKVRRATSGCLPARGRTCAFSGARIPMRLDDAIDSRSIHRCWKFPRATILTTCCSRNRSCLWSSLRQSAANAMRSWESTASWRTHMRMTGLPSSRSPP